MSQFDASQEQQEGTYLLDNESSAEMVRLLDQDKMVTGEMGGLFSERNVAMMEGIFDVLDIGCGPGGWIHEVAHTYPEMEVVGIDISNAMIDYAKAHTLVRNLPNAHFYLMDALKPLDFPDESFDLVNIRFAVAYVPTTSWPQFLTECIRVLRPGGILRLTDGEIGLSNKQAVDTFFGLINQAMQRIGRGFSPTGQHTGIVYMLRYLLRQVGLQHVQSKPHIWNGSFGEKAHEATYQNAMLFFSLAQPLLVNTGVTTQKEIEALAEQALVEMQEEDLCWFSFLLTAWGQKAQSV